MTKTIVTHPGGAHKDDYLACSLVISKYGAPVYRREPCQEDMNDPEVCVIDVGGEYDEQRNNFDHHQFDRNHPEVCALSLILKHFGLYQDAKLFCDWLETSEWMDTRGPVDTATWLGIDRNVMAKLNSPIDMTMLSRFSKGNHFDKGDVVWELMKMVGDDMISFITSMKIKLEFLKQHVRIYKIDENHEDEVAFLPRLEGIPEDISSGMVRYILSLEKANVVAMIYPDRRGDGYGLSRMNDSKKMEYTRIFSEPDVHFAHKRGFIAKVSATEPSRLMELIRKSYLS